MKRIISLILASMFCFLALAACGDKIPEFIPIKDIGLIDVASGTRIKNVDTEEYRTGAAEKYNAVTETKEYSDEEAPLWQIVMCDEDDTVFFLSYLDNGRFNVSVTKGDDNTKYLVVNEALAAYCEEELFVAKEVSVDVTVKIKLDDGAPEESGKILFDNVVTVTGTESDLPAVSGALKAALDKSGLEYKVNEKSNRIMAVGQYADTAGEVNGTVEHIFWAYKLNGEDVAATALEKTEIANGDIVEAIFTKTIVTN